MTQSTAASIRRRRMLARIGLAASAGYAVPALIGLGETRAQDVPGFGNASRPSRPSRTRPPRNSRPSRPSR
jgi:hypothetical protein